MKYEVWLKTNKRAHWLIAILPATALLAGILLVVTASTAGWFWIGILVLVIASLWLSAVLSKARLPRLAYSPGKLLVYLRSAHPIEIPIDVVECFFLGQGASFLPRSLAGEKGASETSTVVVRLAEAATEWHHLDVRPSLGQWCEGYITIRGTWCEPLSGDVVAKLNQRLIAAHQEQKQSRKTVSV